MKFLVIAFALVLVAQHANAAVRFSLKDVLDAYEQEHSIENNNIEIATEALFIPTKLKACINSNCDAVCKALGYSHGVCISSTTCRCSY